MIKYKKNFIKIVFVFIAMAVVTHVFKYRYYIFYYDDTQFVKSFFLKIITSETPDDNWIKLLGPRLGKNPETSFYTFKIWFAEAHVSDSDIRFSYPESVFKDGDKTIIVYCYGRDRPVIHCVIYRSGNMKTADAYFPLNNCLFSPDYNKDGRINSQDFEIVIKNKNIND